MTGSGLAIKLMANTTIVLTAGHVCKPTINPAFKVSSESIVVLDHASSFHDAQLIHVEFDNSKGKTDLCALLVPGLGASKVQVSRRPPKIGEELYYIGAPMGVYHPPSAPIFKGIFSGPIDNSSSLLTVAASGGSSGSVILTLENKVVGVLYAVHPKMHHISIVSRYEPTILFLSKIRKKLK